MLRLVTARLATPPTPPAHSDPQCRTNTESSPTTGRLSVDASTANLALRDTEQLLARQTVAVREMATWLVPIGCHPIPLDDDDDDDEYYDDDDMRSETGGFADDVASRRVVHLAAATTPSAVITPPRQPPYRSPVGFLSAEDRERRRLDRRRSSVASVRDSVTARRQHVAASSLRGPAPGMSGDGRDDVSLVGSSMMMDDESGMMDYTPVRISAGVVDHSTPIASSRQHPRVSLGTTTRLLMLDGEDYEDGVDEEPSMDMDTDDD